MSAPATAGPLRPSGVPARTLGELCRQVPGVHVVDADAPTEVTGISLDSRSIAAGELYVALKGARTRSEEPHV